MTVKAHILAGLFFLLSVVAQADDYAYGMADEGDDRHLATYYYYYSKPSSAYYYYNSGYKSYSSSSRSRAYYGSYYGGAGMGSFIIGLSMVCCTCFWCWPCLCIGGCCLASVEIPVIGQILALCDIVLCCCCNCCIIVGCWLIIIA